MLQKVAKRAKLYYVKFVLLCKITMVLHFLKFNVRKIHVHKQAKQIKAKNYIKVNNNQNCVFYINNDYYVQKELDPSRVLQTNTFQFEAS